MPLVKITLQKKIVMRKVIKTTEYNVPVTKHRDKDSPGVARAGAAPHPRLELESAGPSPEHTQGALSRAPIFWDVYLPYLNGGGERATDKIWVLEIIIANVHISTNGALWDTWILWTTKNLKNTDN